MAAAPAAGGAAAAPAAESTEFSVTLEEVPQDKKIGVIKIVPRNFRSWPQRSERCR